MIGKIKCFLGFHAPVMPYLTKNWVMGKCPRCKRSVYIQKRS